MASASTCATLRSRGAARRSRRANTAPLTTRARQSASRRSASRPPPTRRARSCAARASWRRARTGWRRRRRGATARGRTRSAFTARTSLPEPTDLVCTLKPCMCYVRILPGADRTGPAPHTSVCEPARAQDAGRTVSARRTVLALSPVLAMVFAGVWDGLHHRRRSIEQNHGRKRMGFSQLTCGAAGASFRFAPKCE